MSTMHTMHTTERQAPSVLPEKYAGKIFLDLSDLADILGQDRRTVLGHCERGQMPGAVRFGKLWKVSRVLFEQAVMESGTGNDGYGDGK